MIRLPRSPNLPASNHFALPTRVVGWWMVIWGTVSFAWHFMDTRFFQTAIQEYPAPVTLWSGILWSGLITIFGLITLIAKRNELFMISLVILAVDVLPDLGGITSLLLLLIRNPPSQTFVNFWDLMLGYVVFAVKLALVIYSGQIISQQYRRNPSDEIYARASLWMSKACIVIGISTLIVSTGMLTWFPPLYFFTNGAIEDVGYVVIGFSSKLAVVGIGSGLGTLFYHRNNDVFLGIFFSCMAAIMDIPQVEAVISLVGWAIWDRLLGG